MKSVTKFNLPVLMETTVESLNTANPDWVVVRVSSLVNYSGGAELYFNSPSHTSCLVRSNIPLNFEGMSPSQIVSFFKQLIDEKKAFYISSLSLLNEEVSRSNVNVSYRKLTELSSEELLDGSTSLDFDKLVVCHYYPGEYHVYTDFNQNLLIDDVYKFDYMGIGMAFDNTYEVGDVPGLKEEYYDLKAIANEVNQLSFASAKITEVPYYNRDDRFPNQLEITITLTEEMKAAVRNDFANITLGRALPQGLVFAKYLRPIVDKHYAIKPEPESVDDEDC